MRERVGEGERENNKKNGNCVTIFIFVVCHFRISNNSYVIFLFLLYPSKLEEIRIQFAHMQNISLERKIVKSKRKREKNEREKNQESLHGSVVEANNRRSCTGDSVSRLYLKRNQEKRRCARERMK